MASVKEPKVAKVPKGGLVASAPASVRLIFPTMLRPDLARELIASVRRFHPDIPITLAEQTDGEGELREIEDGNVTRMIVPFDTGLGATRNILVKSIKEKYFILADDDFVITEKLPLEKALRFMEAQEDAVFLGGHVTDIVYRKDGSTVCKDDRRDSNIAIDTTGKGVVLLPREFVGGPQIEFEGEKFLQCDYVANWGIGRTGFFRETGFAWSEEIKIGIEHLDFFLRLKTQHPQARVYFWENLRVEHHRHRIVDENYLQYRRRPEFVNDYEKISGFRYQFDPTLSRVQFFRDYPGQVFLPGSERGRAMAERERFNKLHGAYVSLRDKLVSEKQRHTELRLSLAADRRSRLLNERRRLQGVATTPGATGKSLGFGEAEQEALDDRDDHN